jgi:hypothetical protein
METKLTLKLDKEIIQQAKEYASSKKLSLSKIVEAYLQALAKEKKGEVDIKISPFVKSLSSGTKISADLDYKKEYSNYLTEKYK